MKCYEHNHRDISIIEGEGKLIVVNLLNGVIYALGGIEEQIWRAIPDTDCKGIAVLICKEYDGDVTQIKSDVEDFLNTLIQNGLIVTRDGS